MDRNAAKVSVRHFGEYRDWSACSVGILLIESTKTKRDHTNMVNKKYRSSGIYSLLKASPPIDNDEVFAKVVPMYSTHIPRTRSRTTLASRSLVESKVILL